MTAIQIKATVNYFDEYYDEPYRDVGRILPNKDALGIDTYLDTNNYFWEQYEKDDYRYIITEVVELQDYMTLRESLFDNVSDKTPVQYIKYEGSIAPNVVLERNV